MEGNQELNSWSAGWFLSTEIDGRWHLDLFQPSMMAAFKPFRFPSRRSGIRTSHMMRMRRQLATSKVGALWSWHQKKRSPQSWHQAVQLCDSLQSIGSGYKHRAATREQTNLALETNRTQPSLWVCTWILLPVFGDGCAAPAFSTLPCKVAVHYERRCQSHVSGQDGQPYCRLSGLASAKAQEAGTTLNVTSSISCKLICV